MAWKNGGLFAPESVGKDFRHQRTFERLPRPLGSWFDAWFNSNCGHGSYREEWLWADLCGGYDPKTCVCARVRVNMSMNVCVWHMSMDTITCKHPQQHKKLDCNNTWNLPTKVKCPALHGGVQFRSIFSLNKECQPGWWCPNAPGKNAHTLHAHIFVPRWMRTFLGPCILNI